MNLGAEGLKGNKNIWRDQLVVLSHLPDCNAVRFQDQILPEILMGLQRRNMFNIKQSLMVGKRFRLPCFPSFDVGSWMFYPFLIMFHSRILISCSDTLALKQIRQ